MRPVVPNSSNALILGVDIGSSGLKAVLLDVEKGIVAVAGHSLDLFSPHAGWAEADTEQWWTALCAVIPQLISQVNNTVDQISSVAISGMVPAVVIADANGNALRRAMLQNDARATYEIKELLPKLDGVDLLSLTGSQLSQQSVAPTALWLSKNEPMVWKSTKIIFGSYDWMATKLGAVPHVELNWAIESGLYGWDKKPLSAVLAATGIDWPELLEPKQPGTLVGKISASASAETGLSIGTEIYVGGADHVLSAFGAGLVNDGDCLVKLGGAGDILAVSDEFFIDKRLYLDAHPIPGKWLPNGCMATSGSLLRWEQHLLGDIDLELLDSEAASSEPGALLTLPYFLGEKSPLHDPDLRGVIAGLHLGTTRGDLHRSFLEAIAYGFKQHFQVFEEGGLSINNPRVTNGGSRSRLWREILADVLGRELTSLINHPGASFGAAVCAGVGSGAINDWSYVEGALEQGEVISPNSSHKERYHERYEMYLELQRGTQEISHKLARVN
jgi:xylulokinase